MHLLYKSKHDYSVNDVSDRLAILAKKLYTSTKYCQSTPNKYIKRKIIHFSIY